MTDLSATEWKSYIAGLKDPGGVMTFGANNTGALQTAWASLVSAYGTAASTSKATWFEIMIPGLTNSFYFAGIPANLGLAAMEVDAPAEINLYVTPKQVYGWAAKST